MKPYLKKIICVLLALFLADVPVFADTENPPLVLDVAEAPTAEQLSFSSVALIDDFEDTEDALWEPLYQSEVSYSSDACCGHSAALLKGTGQIGFQTEADGFGIASASGVMLAFKADADCTLSVCVGDIVSSAQVKAGKWYSACADIRERKGTAQKQLLSIECLASGEISLLIDYVCLSVLHTAPKNSIDITDGISTVGADGEFYGGAFEISSYGKSFYIESSRIDRLLENGVNAVSVSVENNASATDITLYYSESGEAFNDKNSQTLPLQSSIKTYVFLLDGCKSLCRFKLSFEGQPSGQILIRDVRLTYSMQKNTDAVCEAKNDGKIRFSCNAPEETQVLLFRSLPNAEIDTSAPYLTANGGEFVFDVIDGGDNNLLYEFSAAYMDSDGNLSFLTPSIAVSSPENACISQAFTEVLTQKAVYGKYEDANTVYLPIDADMFFAKLTTEYYCHYGESIIYFAQNAASKLDDAVIRLTNQGKAVYLCPFWYNTLPQLYNETEFNRFCAFISYLSARYNGGEKGTINGIVIGNGANCASSSFARSAENCRAVMYAANAVSKYENGKIKIILSVENGENAHDVYDFSCALMSSCPYIDGVMLYSTYNEEKAEDTFSAREFADFLEYQSFGDTFVCLSNYGDNYFQCVKDFYSLCFKENVKSIAFNGEEPFVKTDYFKYMDSAEAEKYTLPLCQNDTWESILYEYDVSKFENIKHGQLVCQAVKGDDIAQNDTSVFTPNESNVAKWGVGMGCTSVFHDSVYGEPCAVISLDSTQYKYPVAVFTPDTNVSLKRKTIKIRLRVDYLPTDVQSTEITFTAKNKMQSLKASAQVFACEETTLLIRFDEKTQLSAPYLFEIGTNGGETPRMCIYGLYISDDTQNTVQTEDVQTQSPQETLPSDENGKNSENLAPIIAAVSAFMLICIAVTVLIIDKRNGYRLFGKFLKKSNNE